MYYVEFDIEPGEKNRKLDALLMNYLFRQKMKLSVAFAALLNGSCADQENIRNSS